MSKERASDGGARNPPQSAGRSRWRLPAAPAWLLQNGPRDPFWSRPAAGWLQDGRE